MLYDYLIKYHRGTDNPRPSRRIDATLGQEHQNQASSASYLDLRAQFKLVMQAEYEVKRRRVTNLCLASNFHFLIEISLPTRRDRSVQHWARMRGKLFKTPV